MRHRTESEPHGSAVFELARAATLGDSHEVVLFREYLDAMAKLRPNLDTTWTKAYRTDPVAAGLAARAGARATVAEQSDVVAAPPAAYARDQLTAAPGETAVSTKYVPPEVGTVIAVIPRRY